MKKNLLGLVPFIFCICFRVIAIAQANSDPMKAWIELELQNEVAKVQALFFNPGNQTQTFSYQLDILWSGQNGTANKQQKGQFTVLPAATQILAKAQFYTKNHQFYRIDLKIYDELELILSDSLVYGSDPNKIVAHNNDLEKAPAKPDAISPAPPPLKSPLASANKPAAPQKSFDNLEIDGLIIDETRSKIARDFYDLFYNKWIAPRGASNFSILIRELPSRGRGARISVLINEQEIVQRFVPPRYDTVEDLVNYAINRARQYLAKNEDLKRQLLNEDQSGSGIF